MAKGKGKPARLTVPHREAFERINFLLQAAELVLQSSPPNVELCRHYVSTLKAIARRLVLRIDPLVKRTICRQCNVLLLPGVTALTVIRRKKVVTSCQACGHVLALDTQPEHALATQRRATAVCSGVVATSEDLAAFLAAAGQPSRTQEPEPEAHAPANGPSPEGLPVCSGSGAADLAAPASA